MQEGPEAQEGQVQEKEAEEGEAMTPPRKLIAAAIAAAALAAPATASGAIGSLAYKGCITGKTQAGPAPGGSGACTAIPGTASTGIDSGLNGPASIAVAPDGESVYVASSLDHAIARFDRNPATGALTYQGCLTGSSDGPGAANCTQIPSAQTGGGNSGMYEPSAVVVSSDNESVYVTSFSDSAVARFDRDTTSGALNYQGCLTGSNLVGPTGSGACAVIPSSTAAGPASGLVHPSGLAVTPDGGSVLVTSYDDDSLAVFERNTGSGALAYQGCLTGETNVAGAGSGACTAVPGATFLSGNSGLDFPVSVAVSAGSDSVYVVTEQDDSLVRFSRDPGTGAVAYASCLTAETASSGPCATVAGASAGGANSGLDQPSEVATSPAGGSVYVASQLDDAVTRFETSAGVVTHHGCLSGETQSGPAGSNACALVPTASSAAINSGLDSPLSLAVSADGKSLYTSSFYASVARFTRAASGALGWGDCVTGNTNTAACAPVAGAVPTAAGSGLDQLGSIAGSADGASLYTGSITDDAVARFDRALTHPPAVTLPVVTPATPSKKRCKKGTRLKKGKCVRGKKRKKR
jgi:DNA-binding beta-propeller fold protein YncE